MLKIVLTGTESTGKTTLASRLASHYATLWVPEFARSFLENLGRPYRQTDLLDIAKGQIALEDERAKQAGHLLVCDTGLEVLKVWSEFKYGSCHPWILEQLHRRRYDLHLLCEPDLPWTFDPLRENPAARRELHEIYRRELLALGANFTGLKGFGEERFQLAVTAVDELLSRQLLPHE